MCFSINIWNLLTLSAVLMCSGKLFHNLAPWYVREFRPWIVEISLTKYPYTNTTHVFSLD